MCAPIAVCSAGAFKTELHLVARNDDTGGLTVPEGAEGQCPVQFDRVEVAS